MSEQKTGIEFDKSDREVLVVCHDCGGVWRAFAWTMSEAEQSAMAHQDRAHPGTREVRQRVTNRHAMRKKRGTNPESVRVRG